MTMKTPHATLFLSAALIPALLIATQQGDKSSDAKSAALVVASDVDWGALNPARGENGPRAGNLWGDRTGTGATGFLVRFKDGFSSPPHIHNVTYRGVVISGLVHNDDPKAEKMWMPPGSYWTQPAGEVHITAAKGEDVVAYIEIQSGPYLVLPAEQANDNGERPINVDPSNVVWLDAANSSWIDQSAKSVEITFLWGQPHDDGPTATLVKLPAGFKGRIQSDGSPLRAVVVTGKPSHQRSDKSSDLEPGNYFGSEGEASHQISSPEESILYLRTDGKFEIVSAQE